MAPQDETPATLPKVPGKRRFHNKVTTACKTCKIRKVRCDEQKPECKRCITSGRQCDGYSTLLSHPLPRGGFINTELTLAISSYGGPGRPAKESRGFRFFLEVAAPSLAGAMHSKFWLSEVPRLCQQDSAVWHAIVSLSSAFERRGSGKDKQLDVFTLQQCNSAIRCLRESCPPQSWWRALVISTIFICICYVGGDYHQMQIHFKSGYNILQEFDTEKKSKTLSSRPTSSSSIPISLPTLRSILVGFEMRINRLSTTKVSQLPTLLSRDDSVPRWKSYKTPNARSASGRYLTPAALGQAISAAEDLFYNLAISSGRYLLEFKSSYVAGKKNGLKPTMDKESRRENDTELILCFKEIDHSLRVFLHELETCHWPRAKAVEEARLRRGVLSLSLAHANNRYMLVEDPDEPDPVKRLQGVPDLCTEIVDLAEKALRMEKMDTFRQGETFIPTSTIMNPLYGVARCGIGAATRQRAWQLLQRPRVEGLWESAMAAGLAKAVMDREKEATQEYWENEGVVGIVPDDYSARGWLSEASPEDNVHTLARVANVTMTLGSERHVDLCIRTLHEFLEDLPGKDVTIQW